MSSHPQSRYLKNSLSELFFKDLDKAEMSIIIIKRILEKVIQPEVE